MKLNKIFAAGAIVAFASAALAAVTFDTATGVGFVGKGDVQLALTWNNAALQRNAGGVTFSYDSIVVSEVSWECTNEKNDKIQERERTTTSSTQGVVTAVARDGKNQITGFNLNGWNGQPTTTVGQTEGPALNSCPNENGNWFLSTSAGLPVISSTGGLYVSHAGTKILLQ